MSLRAPMNQYTPWIKAVKASPEAPACSARWECSVRRVARDSWPGPHLKAPGFPTMARQAARKPPACGFAHPEETEVLFVHTRTASRRGRWGCKDAQLS